jgi:hypothetical protein
LNKPGQQQQVSSKVAKAARAVSKVVARVVASSVRVNRVDKVNKAAWTAIRTGRAVEVRTVEVRQ